MENKAIKRVLVVEDEWLIAACLEEMLLSLGFEVVGPAPNIKVALALIETELLDFALLDVSLGAEKSFSIADKLKNLGVPFLFLTGYLYSDLPKGYSQATIVAKPICKADLIRALPFHVPNGLRIES